MASGSGFKRLKRLSAEIPDDESVHTLLRALDMHDTPSDYATAVIGASLVERALEAGIVSKFVPLVSDNRNLLFSFDQKGPLVDLIARIRIGHALGLFGPETMRDLESIRHI